MFCFGTFFEIIRSGIAKRMPDDKLALQLLGAEWIGEHSADIKVIDKSVASRLRHCKMSVPSEYAAYADTIEYREYIIQRFRCDELKIHQEKVYTTIQQVRELIEGDDSIPKEKKTELLSADTSTDYVAFLPMLCFMLSV